MCFFAKMRAVHSEIMSIEQQDLVEFVVPNIPMEFRREFSWQPRYSGPVKPPVRTENGSSVYVVFYRVGWFSCLSNFRHRVTYVGGWKTTVPEATYVDEPGHRNSALWDGYQKCQTQLKYELTRVSETQFREALEKNIEERNANHRSPIIRKYRLYAVFSFAISLLLLIVGWKWRIRQGNRREI